MSVTFESVFGREPDDGGARVTDIGDARPTRSREPRSSGEAIVTELPPVVDAERVSMRALARSAKSVAEMHATLIEHEVSASAAATEIERLIACGLLDDAALAVDLVDRLRTRKKLGDRAMRVELRRRRIDDEAIAAALDDEHDELALAIDAARQRARQLTRLDHETAHRRLAGYLQRRGFGGSVLTRALDAALPRHTGGPRFR